MTKFVEIARRAKQEHDARLALARAQAAAEQRRREEAFVKAVAALRAEVAPTLRRAQAELASDELALVIEDNFSARGLGAVAEVSIRIVGEAIPATHAGRVKPESVQAFFSHDGETLSFGMATRRGRLAEAMRPVTGGVGEAIEYAIAQVSASYYSDIEATLRASFAEATARPA